MLVDVPDQAFTDDFSKFGGHLPLHCTQLSLPNTWNSVRNAMCSGCIGALRLPPGYSASGDHSADTKECAVNQGSPESTQHFRRQQPATDHTVKPSKANPQVNHGYEPWLSICNSIFRRLVWAIGFAYCMNHTFVHPTFVHLTLVHVPPGMP